ncbi:hypothetical protein EVAR_84317_1 [Eumeta japonica]|uniref:Uncharacterized protein n=1 Tax=Eumeta variegata TaxID=151549 RepID=A0A4C1U5E3_EUMVA|nr:hypothetical protein EVAR_84317_1 [Eumeta japonica]
MRSSGTPHPLFRRDHRNPQAKTANTMTKLKPLRQYNGTRKTPTKNCAANNIHLFIRRYILFLLKCVAFSQRSPLAQTKVINRVKSSDQTKIEPIPSGSWHSSAEIGIRRRRIAGLADRRVRNRKLSSDKKTAFYFKRKKYIHSTTGLCTNKNRHTKTGYWLSHRLPFWSYFPRQKFHNNTISAPAETRLLPHNSKFLKLLPKATNSWSGEIAFGRERARAAELRLYLLRSFS